MASIGRFSFTQWRIRMPVIVRPKVRKPPRSGVPQNVIVRGDYRSAVASGWTAAFVASEVIARSLLNEYVALAASTDVVQVVDQFGIRFSHVSVLSAAGDGTAFEISKQLSGVRLDCFWTLDVGFA